MGSLKDLVDKMPGVGGMMPPGVDLDDKELVRIEAMIQSMTKEERRDPHSLVREPSRVRRVAGGSGQPEQGVSELIQKFLFMKQMMDGLGQNAGLLGKIPGMKNVAMARNMRRAMKSGKFPGGGGAPGMPGMPGMGMPGMPGMPPGMGMPGMPGMGLPGMGMPPMGAPDAGGSAESSRNAQAQQVGEERAQESAQAAARGSEGEKGQEAMNNRYPFGRWLAVSAALLFGVGCEKPADQEEIEIEPALEAYILEEVPNDLQHPILLDFEGKVHLVGYHIDPEGPVKRGDTVNIKMYWRGISPLTKGWKLFTHVLDDRGRQVVNLDNEGPIRKLVPGNDGEQRQALGPSLWKVGKVYVDEQTITIPTKYPNSDRELTSETVAIAVGVWKYAPRRGKDGGVKGQADMRLDIVGGKSDGNNRGIVVRLDTDYQRPQAVEQPKSE